MEKVTSGCCPFTGSTTTSAQEATNSNYNALYHYFVQQDDGSEPATSIPSILHGEMADADDLDFIVIGSTSLLIHSYASAEKKPPVEQKLL